MVHALLCSGDMVRLAVFVGLALVGCQSSPEDTLTDLQSRAARCGEIEDTGVKITDPATALACMNQALANRTLSEASWADYDDAMFVTTTYVFADGGRVRELVAQPDDFGGPDITITEKPSCAGPFALTPGSEYVPQVLSINGCP